MNKINWKQKLSSRKFWLALIGFVTTVLVAFNVDSLTVEQIAAIISGVGALVVYIIGESYVDGKRATIHEATIEEGILIKEFDEDE